MGQIKKRARPATASADASRFRHRSRGEFVYSELRAQIQSRSLRAGDRLREEDLAGRLKVSRTPVREALKRLEGDGLIVFAQSRGLVVAELNRAQVLELYAMREILEGAAARFAATHATDVEIQLLQSLVTEQGAHRTPATAAGHNRRFHQAIASAAHNGYLLKAMNGFQDALALLEDTTFSRPGRMKGASREHSEIVECIARRDADGAEDAARRHIRVASVARLGMMFV